MPPRQRCILRSPRGSTGCTRAVRCPTTRPSPGPRPCQLRPAAAGDNKRMLVSHTISRRKPGSSATLRRGSQLMEEEDAAFRCKYRRARGAPRLKNARREAHAGILGAGARFGPPQNDLDTHYCFPAPAGRGRTPTRSSSSSAHGRCCSSKGRNDAANIFLSHLGLFGNDPPPASPRLRISASVPRFRRFL